MPGTLIVSLDFELFWGMLEVCPLDDYREHILGGRRAIPKILSLFEKYGIHATWAAVGFQFGRDAQEVLAYAPSKEDRPSYENPTLDPYGTLEHIRKEDADCFFAPELVELVAKAPGQELGSHTFCHYYCREKGQTLDQFAADLRAAQAIAGAKGFSLTSLVLPRNESEPEYIALLPELGFTAYRSEERDWIHHIPIWPLLRAFRLLDVYLPLTGQGGYIPQKESGVWNLTGSRAFKTIRPALRPFEGLKMARIKSQMRHAAKHGLTFHLWWHPHNLGVNTEEHLKELEELLQYYVQMKEQYGMQSLNMREAARRLEEQ